MLAKFGLNHRRSKIRRWEKKKVILESNSEKVEMHLKYVAQKQYRDCLMHGFHGGVYQLKHFPSSSVRFLSQTKYTCDVIKLRIKIVSNTCF